MAHLQRRDPESNGQGDIVRSWDAGTNGFPESSSDAQSFKKQAEQVLDLLQRRKWLIILTCLAVVVGAALYTYTQVPIYRTSSLVLVDKNQQSGSGTEIESGSQGSGLLPSSGSSLENELIFLRNSQSLRTRVAERLVERGDARRVLGSKGASPLGRLSNQALRSAKQSLGVADEPQSENTSTASVGSDSADVSAASVARVLVGRVEFSRANDKTNVIQITAQDEDPEVARLLADLYTDEYIALTRESSRARVTASREFLQKRAQELEQELETIERRIQRYQRREDATGLDSKEGSLAGKVADTETSLEEARIELKMEKSSLESLQKELRSIQPDQLSEQVGSTVKQEIEALQSKIAELELSKQQLQLQSGTLTAADSAQVAQIDQRIQSLRTQISRLADKHVDEMMTGGLSAEGEAQRINDLRRRIAEKEIKISGLESRIELLSERLREYESELDAIPEKSMELAQLRREQKYAEQMYGYVTKQLQQTRVREKSELGYATNIAEAATPEAPVRPRPQRNLMLGLILGLLGGAALALIRDQMDNRIYKPDQVREMGYHQIGVIPNLTPLVEDQLDGQATVEWDGRQLESNLVGVLKPYSAAAEAYRKVWTNLQLGRPDETNTTVLVTSPGSGDGKSLTAANLATVTAQAGHSTLLIDGDLRRPRLHEVFDISRTPGVTEALQNDLEEDAMRRPLVDNLCVLPAGTEVENPAKVLGSSRFRDFLQRAEQYFDHVIVDSSPVLATADGPLLSDLCETTLCLARAGATTEAELDHAMEVLSGVGANVAGVVFNGFDISMAYGYKYRYRHYDQYGPYDQYRSLPEEASA
jgi:capsular exopolysaccharide synthesis family protein